MERNLGAAPEQSDRTDLAAMARLHELSVRLTAMTDLSSILREVLDAVMELQAADFGDVQLFNKKKNVLEIVAHRGLGQEFLDYFRSVNASDGSACALALKARTRIIIEDVTTDPSFAAHRAIAARTGFRAVQSTPLFERGSGAPVGMISTHFRKPHRPSERDLRLTDLYAIQAADVIAFRLAEQRLRASEEHLRLALESGRMGTWEWDTRSELVITDAVCRSIFGLPPQSEPQPTQIYWARMVPEEVATGLERARAALKDGTEFQMEQRVIRSGGEVRWMLSRGRAKHDDPNCMIGITFDITERQRVEETLHQSEKRLQAAVDLLGLGLYAWNPQTNALIWDARLKAMWGLPPHAHVDYEVWRQRVHPDDLARVEAAVDKCVDPNGDGVYGLEYRVIGWDGVERWVRTRGQTTFHPGRAVGFLGVALDITERKRTEERLRESEARLAAVLQQLPIAVGLVDRDGRFLLRGGLLSSLWDEVMPSHDPAQRRRWRSYDADGQLLQTADYPGARALRGETVLPGTDFIHTADDGHETWLRVSAAPFHNAAGEVDGAVAIMQDVDAAKRAEQAIRESEERFRQFAEHSTNVLWILNVDTRRLEYLSPAYEGVWTQPRHATRGYWMDAIHADDRERAMAGFERALLGELVVQEYRVVRPDGAVSSIRDTMFPIRDQQQRLRWVGGIAQDITVHDGMQTYVIDADPASRREVSQLLQHAGYAVKTFDSGGEFLEIASVLALGCVVLDVRSSQAAGLEVLRRLKASASDLPVIVIGTSSGNVALAVQAMKVGAVDWLETPYEEDALLMAVASALADIRRAAEQQQDAEFGRARIAGLSARERQVLEGLLAGGTNKVIGRELGISPRTVELHRASVMERLGVKTLPEAVLIAAAAGVRPDGPPPKSKPPRKSP
jgi:PAS domain S-box-containing protein